MSTPVPESTPHTPPPRHIRIRLVPYTPPFALQGTAQHHTASPSLRFAPIDRLLPPNTPLKIGRFTDRHAQRPSTRPPLQDDIRFRSKVVSRHHAEMWVGEDGNLYLRDTASSSGTFLNQVRLSAQNVQSAVVRLRDGDCIQLGVEYRGGEEEVYRCVRMRVEIDRAQEQCRNYRKEALAAITGGILGVSPSPGPQTPSVATAGNAALAPPVAADTCCICLMPLRHTPLLITTCLHCFHYGCIKPMLRITVRAPNGGKVIEEEADGFQCPICRTYVDLNAEPMDEDDDGMELGVGVMGGGDMDRTRLEEVVLRQQETLREVHMTTTTTTAMVAAVGNEAGATPGSMVMGQGASGIASGSHVIETVAVGSNPTTTTSNPLPTSTRTVQSAALQIMDEPVIPLSGEEGYDEDDMDDDGNEQDDERVVEVFTTARENPESSDDGDKDDGESPLAGRTLNGGNGNGGNGPRGRISVTGPGGGNGASGGRDRQQRTSRWWFGGSHGASGNRSDR